MTHPRKNRLSFHLWRAKGKEKRVEETETEQVRKKDTQRQRRLLLLSPLWIWRWKEKKWKCRQHTAWAILKSKWKKQNPLPCNDIQCGLWTREREREREREGKSTRFFSCNLQTTWRDVIAICKMNPVACDRRDESEWKSNTFGLHVDHRQMSFSVQISSRTAALSHGEREWKKRKAAGAMKDIPVRSQCYSSFSSCIPAHHNCNCSLTGDLGASIWPWHSLCQCVCVCVYKVDTLLPCTIAFSRRPFDVHLLIKFIDWTPPSKLQFGAKEWRSGWWKHIESKYSWGGGGGIVH